jgi:glucose/arabinose dehydrogenase
MIRFAFAAAAALLATASAAFQPGPAPASPPDLVRTESGPLAVEHLARLDNPWGMAFLPDGGLLITEKPGRLRLYANGRLSAPIAGVPQVVDRSQGGLLDVAIDPDFAHNHLVYVYYVEAAAVQPAGAHETQEPRFNNSLDLSDTILRGGAVARGRLEGGALRDVQVIWRQVPKTIGRGHFGGRLVFAPDHSLFITSGERMRFDPAQDMTANLGKVIHINADGSIPADNPFLHTRGARPDIWTLGHRNLLGIAFQPGTGRLWVDEMGPRGGDEFNLIEPGHNYGWPLVSQGNNYDNSPIPRHETRPDFTPPVRSWNPVISPSGLIFYAGSLLPWRGNAVLGGLSSRSLIRLTLDGTRVTGEERIPMGRRIRDLIEARDGSLLVLTDGDNGELLRLSPARP